MTAPIIVTGAAGYLGGRLVRHLRESGTPALAVVRTAGQGAGLLAGTEVVEIDLATGHGFDRLPARCRAIVHLAQSRRYREFPEAASDIWSVNVDSTLRLLEYGRTSGAEAFLLASTGGVYGGGPEPVVERPISQADLIAADPVGTLRFYFTSKLAAEMLVGAYAGTLRGVLMRPFFLYGPGQQGMIVANLLSRVLAEQEITIQGNPGIRFNPLHVDDAIGAIVAILDSSFSGIVNLAGPESLTITDLVRRMASCVGRGIKLSHADAPHADLLADTTLLRDIVGYRPVVGIDRGLGSMLAA